MCRVAVVSGGVWVGGWVGGVGGWVGWGGWEGVTIVVKVCPHTNTAKSLWRATNVHPSNHEFARRLSLTRARKQPACFIVSMYGQRVAIIARLPSSLECVSLHA